MTASPLSLTLSGRMAAASPPDARLRRRWIPSFASLVFGACLVIAVLSGSRLMSDDGDAARHLVVGKHIIETGTIPATNIFSHTLSDRLFIAHEWLAEVLSAASYEQLGLAGPVLLHGAAIALAFAVLYSHLRARGHSVLLALAIVTLAGLATRVHWLARPHAFSFLGVASTALLLDGWYSGRFTARTLWLLVPGLCLWANLHGGFLYGLATIGAYVTADLLRLVTADRALAHGAYHRLRQLLPAALVGALSTALHPNGPNLWLHVADYFSSDLIVSVTTEFRSPDFHQAAIKPFLAILLILFGGIAVSRHRPAAHHVFLLLGMTTLALQSARHIAPFALLTAPLVAAVLCDLSLRINADSALGRIAAGAGIWFARRNDAYARIDSRAAFLPGALLSVATLVGVALATRDQTPLGVRFDPSLQPVEASRYLVASAPPGYGFNEQHWGGFLLHALGPGSRVFIDGEVSARTEDLVADYLTIAALRPGWQNALSRHNVDWVIFSTSTPLVSHLRELPDWRVLHEDSTATVLARVTPGSPR